VDHSHKVSHHAVKLNLSNFLSQTNHPLKENGKQASRYSFFYIINCGVAMFSLFAQSRSLTFWIE